MCTKQVRIRASTFSTPLGPHGLEVVTDKFERAVSVEESRPQVHLPPHRPATRRIAAVRKRRAHGAGQCGSPERRNQRSRVETGEEREERKSKRRTYGHVDNT